MSVPRLRRIVAVSPPARRDGRRTPADAARSAAPAREPGGGVQRDEVHVRPERSERRQELGQRVGQLGARR